MTEIRCIHRHTEATHPNCFKKGLIKRTDWWRNKTIAYLDIETTGFHADIGIMLTWCIKYQNKATIVYGRITKQEIFDGEYDKRIVAELLDELENVDIVVTFYGSGFDIPFLRPRAFYHGFEFFEFGSKYHWDLFFYCRRLFKLTRKSLDNITAFLGIEGKTHLKPRIWAEARYGQKKELDEVLNHNMEDVIILEKLHNRIWSQAKWQRTSL